MLLTSKLIPFKRLPLVIQLVTRLLKKFSCSQKPAGLLSFFLQNVNN